MKFTKNDWIQKALEILNKEGNSAIMIDHMCARLRITKGSFYHYFDGIDEFIFSVVKLWQKQLLEQLDKIKTSQALAEKKLDLMSDLTFQYSAKTELGLRGWAIHIKRVKTIVDGVEKQRTAMLEQIFSDLGASKQHARELAELAYAGWIGILICESSSVNRKQALMDFRDSLMSSI